MSHNPAGHGLPSLGGRYEVEEFLGQGSTGRVYRARDRQLGRTVAVKVLRSSDPCEIERFQSEARAQARIDHEHVCRVFDVDTIDGVPFIAMQFINGTTLREVAPDLSLDEKTEAVEQAARAVQAAHASGVIHRDLKPGNIMIERRPDGGIHAVVVDFGIARARSDPDDRLPALSSGTPAFMAPEQVISDEVDHRADVYGLGATLYGTIAEQVPFFGVTRAEVKRRILNEQPLALGLVVPGTPEDLEVIAAVAMDKNPRARYPTAAAFARDLARWRRGEPIEGRAGGPVYRVQTWLRAHRLTALAIASVVVIGGVLSAAMLRQQVRTDLRAQLIERYQVEVEQMDRVLRRARMMPQHDTTDAEEDVRRRLQRIEASLIEHGPLARGPAYFALGFGHLLLRETYEAEHWLRAALDAGFSRPEVCAALGVVLAIRVGHARSAGETIDPVAAEEAIRLLAATGAGTRGRDRFHAALAHFVAGDLDGALREARASIAETPWLYEARQLEGDVLVERARRRADAGDLEGAVVDLQRAGDAYAAGLSVGRSDAWLHAAEAARLELMAELARSGGAIDESEPGDDGLRRRSDEPAAESDGARPR